MNSANAELAKLNGSSVQRSKMRLLLCTCLLIIGVMGMTVGQNGKCKPNVCQLVKCGVKESSCTGNQVFRQFGGFCGCCSACVTQLGVGEACVLPKEGYSPPLEECGEGLKCDKISNTCVVLIEGDCSYAAQPKYPADAVVYASLNQMTYGISTFNFITDQ
ncbi:hypothetical protein JTE90_010304 [Oedothorax gibbosus]|uniref:IGFBP N-terminal domain-containing protein n=1 Tax=Oedothorax gibbosus TaxID=931172 RepID=A0AAV6V330_9ARAC|nr:hypothetical protein JTE90_010304 [Oedothorax gibbosus]